MSSNQISNDLLSNNVENSNIDKNDKISTNNLEKIDDDVNEINDTNTFIKSSLIENKIGLNFNYRDSNVNPLKATRIPYESSMKSTIHQYELVILENENLKLKVIELEDELNKEKSKYQEKILSDNSNITEVERYLRLEIDMLQSKNKTLENKLYLANLEIESAISRFEKDEIEKNREFDKIVEEKQQFYEKYYVVKEELNKINEENKFLKEEMEFIQKEKQEKLKLKKINSELKDEIYIIKNDFKLKINQFKYDLEEMKSNFLEENNSLKKNMILLNEVINSLEIEKNQLINEFEERTDKFKFELLSIEDKQLSNLIRNSKYLFSPIKKKEPFNSSKKLNILLSPGKNIQIIKNKERQSSESIDLNSQNMTINKNNSLETINKLKNINDLIYDMEKNIPKLKKNYHGVLIKLKKNLNSEKIVNEINCIDNKMNEKIDKYNKIENDLSE